MIKFQDIIKLDSLKDYKVRLNLKMWKDGSPVYDAQFAFFSDPKFYSWCSAYNGRTKCINRKYLITFAKLVEYSDLWLFTGIYKVLNYNEKLKKDKKGYIERAKLEKIDTYADFEGKLIVKYHKSIQAYVLKAENLFEDDFSVHSLLDEQFDDEYFKGYAKVNLNYTQLKHIFNKEKKDWKTALENTMAVYLIRDENTHKLYVGSATGEKMLWQRWKDYVENGHGGDVELKKLIKEQGFDYIVKFFHYSILETFSPTVDTNYVLERESFWKNVLFSRVLGYNDN